MVPGLCMTPMPDLFMKGNPMQFSRERQQKLKASDGGSTGHSLPGHEPVLKGSPQRSLESLEISSGTELLPDNNSQPLVGHCGNGCLDRVHEFWLSVFAWYREEVCEKAHRLISSTGRIYSFLLAFRASNGA